MQLFDPDLFLDLARLRQRELEREARAASGHDADERGRTGLGPGSRSSAGQRRTGSGLQAGFAASLLLWLGIVSFGLLYALRALEAGLGPLEALAVSLLVLTTVGAGLVSFRLARALLGS